MRGILQRNKESKIYADGRTYDSKLYTFKECDYRHIWLVLDIMVKQLDLSNSKAVRNLSPKENDKKQQKQKRDRIDRALEKEGVPNPNVIDDEYSSSMDDEEDEEDDVYIDGNHQKILVEDPNNS